MTPEYAKIAIALSRRTFLPGSWDKRFARAMDFLAGEDKPETKAQRVQLLRLAHKYRRQLETEIIILAQDEGEKSLTEIEARP
jgi:hypothetical protein